MTEWIASLEACLEISIRKGFYVSPDDLRQLRNKHKIDEQYINQLSKRIVLYDRRYIVEHLPAPHKRVEHKLEPEHIATWLELYPQTIINLLKSGLYVPHMDDAGKIVAQRIKDREKTKKSA